MWNQIKNRLQNILFLALIIGLLGVTFTGLSEAKAANEIQFGIQPASPKTESNKSGYFIVNGQPGEVIHDNVAVVNTGSAPVTLLIFPVDAGTKPQSGASYSNLQEPRKDVGAWITLDKTEITIEAQKQIIVPFTMIVPKEALSGQHLGGIVVQQKNDDTTTKSTSNFGVNVINRAITPVKVNVGGANDISSLKINSAQINTINKESILSLTLLNDGTGFIKPKGDVTLTDATGKVVMNSKLDLDNILPQDSIAYSVPGTLPGIGTYKVHASLDFGGTAPAVYDGQVEIKAQPVNAVATVPATQASATQPAVANASGQPAATTGTNAAVNSTSNSTSVAPASSDNSSMMMGILIGVIAVLGLATLGLGGYVLVSRSKKAS